MRAVLFPEALHLVFLAPAFLLLSALAALLPFLHKSARITKLRMASLVIWRRLQASAQQTRFLRKKPNFTLPMILQMACLILLGLALSRPILDSHPHQPRHIIYVLNASLDMQQKLDDESLFSRASAELKKQIDNHDDPDTPLISLIRAGAQPKMLFARQTYHPQLWEKIAKDLIPDDAKTDWQTTAHLISLLQNKSDLNQIYLYSNEDGAELQNWLHAPVSVKHFLASRPNASLQAHIETAAKDQLQLKGTIGLTGGLTQSQLTVDFKRIGATQALRLATQTHSAPKTQSASNANEIEFTIDLPNIGDGILSAYLSDDGNAADNHVSFIVHAQPKSFEILLIGDAKPDLLQTLQAWEGAHITQMARLPNDTANYDLVIAIDTLLDAKVSTNLLLIGQSRFTDQAKPDFVEPGDVTFWQSHHAVSQGLAWTNLTIKRAFKFTPWPDGDVLLAAGETNLIEARSTQSGRQIRIAFDPRSDWNKQTSFAQFLGNLRLWLGPQRIGRIDQPCLVGTICPIDARWHSGRLERLTDAKLTSGPNNQTLELPPPGQDLLPLQAGIYHWSEGQAADLVAINPDLTPRAKIASNSIAPANAEPATKHLWPYLLGMSALLLIAEFYLSHRQRRISAPSRVSRTIIIGFIAASLLNLPAPGWNQRQSKIIVIGADYKNDIASLTQDKSSQIIYTNAQKDQPITSNDALTLAAALIPPMAKGEIELRGKLDLTRANVADLVTELQSRAIEIKSNAEITQSDDLIIRDVSAPQSLFAGESFTLTARIKSPKAISGHLVINEDSKPIFEQDIDLTTGENSIEAIIPHAKEGRVFYSVALTQINSSAALPASQGLFVQARLAPRILILGTGPSTKEFSDRLTTQGLQTKTMVPTGAPWLIEDWLAYDGYVFMDVPAIALNSTQQNLLVEAVARHARPLLIMGGPHSFGPGGYLETPLDQLSPVSSRVPKPSPEAAVAFVIDRSGSMAQAVGDSDRLQIAKQATLTAIQQLNPQSKVSVIAFDTEARLIAPLQPVSQIDELKRQLGHMVPGGGTDLYPALEMALDQLRNADSSIKHVIVFTDGLTPPAPFEALVNEMTSAGMTVSTVSIGTWAGDVELRNIAKKGGGAFHSTNDFKALPSIMAQEAMLMSDSAIEERTTQPRWSGTRPAFLATLPDQMPQIDGYVLTTSKAEADTSLNVTTEDGGDTPLLASWHYGSGRVLAFTTQAIGDWTKNWQSSPDYQQLWTHVLPHFLTGADSTGLNLVAVREQNSLVIKAHVLDKMRNYRQGLVLSAQIKLINPASEARPINLAFSEPKAGQYEGRLPYLEQGDYEINLTHGEQSQTIFVRNAPVISDPEESQRALQALIQSTLSKAELQSRPEASHLIWHSDWRFWALLAYLIFSFELLISYGLLDNIRKSRLR